MSTVLKADISQAMGQAFIDDIFLQKSRYFYTIGRSFPWTDGLTPDQVVQSEKYQKESRRDILYAKQISGTSLSFIVPRYNYQTNVVYDKYDDSVDMSGKRFYVINSDYNVYKCIDNNVGAKTLIEPYGTSPDPLTLSDGYTWQYIYTVPPSLRTKFLTDDFMPVFNAITERYYSRGSISAVKINSGGSGYTQSSTQIVVSGDGYLQDNPVSIDDFFIGSKGSGYTSTPTVETADQFNSFTSYSGSMNLIKGQRVKVSDAAGVRFYEATTSGITSSTTPTHYYSTASNGTVQLKHIGTKPKISATVVATAVGKIVVTEGGFGYQSTPSVTKDAPGSGCTLTPIISNGVLTEVKVTSNGSGYSSQDVTVASPYPSATAFPTTTIVSVGAVYYATVLSNIYYYRVDVAGTTGSSAPTHTTGTATNGTAVVTVVGKQAKAKAILGTIDTVTKYLDVSNISIINGGSGYVQASTTVVFTGGNPTIPAVANAVVSGGVVTSINITFPGYGYQSAPSVTISGVGSSASLGVQMQCGYGYSLAPTLKFSAPNNAEGAEPFVFSTVSKTEAKIDPVIIGGILRGVTVRDGGVGYTLANLTVVGAGTGASITPIFASSELNTVQAQAELLTTAGTVSSFVVSNQGNNITSLSVQLNGDGTGASVIPVVENGKLVNIKVSNAGENYSYLDVVLTVNNDAVQPVARAILAPINGHGSNPIKELYANGVALNVPIGAESNKGFPFNNEFRQISILKSPLVYGEEKLLEDSSASACIAISANTTGKPIQKNMVLQGTNNSSYRVIDFTSSKILLSAITSNVPVAGNVLTFTLNNIDYNIQVDSVELPEFDKNSGELLYIDNRDSFTPSASQTINVTTTINFT